MRRAASEKMRMLARALRRLASEIEGVDEDSKRAVRSLKINYGGKTGVKDIPEERYEQALLKAVKDTLEDFKAASSTGEEIDVFYPYSNMSRKVTVSRPMDEGWNAHFANKSSYNFVVSDQDTGDEKWTMIGDVITKKAADNLDDLRTTEHERATRESEELDEEIHSDVDLAAFMEDARSLGFSSAIGGDHSIGENVPEEFFDLFKVQSQNVKRLFIEYVKKFSVYDPSMEMADGPQYSIDNDRYNERVDAKSKFISKLESLR